MLFLIVFFNSATLKKKNKYIRRKYWHEFYESKWLSLLMILEICASSFLPILFENDKEIYNWDYVGNILRLEYFI